MKRCDSSILVFTLSLDSGSGCRVYCSVGDVNADDDAGSDV